MFVIGNFSNLQILLIFFWQVVEIPEDILKVRQEIEAEIYDEDQTWGRSEANVSSISAPCHMSTHCW